MKAPLPPGEPERLKALHRYEVLDTGPEQNFDDITLLAAHICETPIAMISLIDENRQWFKSRVGMTVSETARDIAFCAHGILQTDIFVVNDAQADERFSANPLVTGNPRLRFYAGAPLVTPDGHALGMLCVNDQKPRELTAEQQVALQALSRQVVAQLESRRSMTELRRTVLQLNGAKEELRWRTALLEAQLNSSIDGVLVVDAEGRNILQNQRFVDLLKIPPHLARENSDEKQLRWFTNLIKNPESFLEKVHHLYAHPDEISRDEIELKDGTTLDRYSSPVLGQDGKRYGRIWKFRDITKQKRAEETLRQSEEKFRQLAENINDVFWMTSPDLQQVFYTSPAYEQVWGRPVAGLHERPQEWADAILSEERERVMASFGRIMAGEPNVSVEFRIRRPTGEVRWIHSRGFPVRDASGKITRLTGVATDITERKRAEEVRDRFVAILECTTDMVGISDPAGHCIYFNRAGRRLLGLGADEDITAASISDFHLPGDAVLMEGIPAAIRHGIWEGETVLLSRNGQRIPVSQVIIAHKSPAGKLEFISALMRDIRERKKAEVEMDRIHQQLLEASRLAGMAEIASSVLHNVGNVLNSVNISTGLLLERVQRSKASGLARVMALLREHTHDLGEFITNDARGKHVPAHLERLSERLLAEQAEQINELDLLRRNVEHIKEIVAMQQGYAKAGGVKEMVNVATLVEDSMRLNEGALSRHHVKVIREYGDVPALNVEKHKILQILVNLLHNAKHACEESGRADKCVTVQVAGGNDRVRISVIDNGAGIPLENLTRIFNYGFTTRKGGHGIGLHGSALAAKEMGGSLTALSDGPGQGAIFTLELPCPKQETAHE